MLIAYNSSMSRVAASLSPLPSPALASSPTLADLLTTADVDLESLAQFPRQISFVLHFQNLTYSVKLRRNQPLRRRLFPPCHNHAADMPSQQSLSTKTILDDISGEAREGEIMAVMGASGSGKSTLIDALANRMVKGSVKGSITLNGEQLESKLQKAISAYVMQDDMMFSMLTVEETLTFAAEFRLPRSVSQSKKKARVQTLIDQLGLRSAANTIIGDEEHRGVSGGERRRVSIGTDIIHDPILLFLDEPTSGLDSTSAFMVVKVLQRIANTGSIIIMSIHQPSHRILQLFNQLIFMSRGKVVYSGTPKNLPAFFSDFGNPIPAGENPADFALDLIRELEDSKEGTESLVEFNKSWQTGFQFHSRSNLSLKDAITGSISRGKLFSGAPVAGGAVSIIPKFINPPWIEFAVLSKRSFTNLRRSPKMFTFRVATIAVTGIILGTVFFRLDNSPTGVQEKLGFSAFSMATAFYTCADALPIYLQERDIFMRETAYNAYRRSSYVFSAAFVFLPVLLILSLVLAAVTFPAVGLTGSFPFYFLVIFASYWAGNSFVTFLSGVVPQVILGYIIVVALLGYSLLFSGFFINRDRIPIYWIWFHYISLIKYPYEAVLKNEFHHSSSRCFVTGIHMFDGTPLAAAPEAAKIEVLRTIGREFGMNITATTCVTTGAEILRRQGVGDLSKWGCLWVTVGWGFLFRILFYFSLLLGSKNKRK